MSTRLDKQIKQLKQTIAEMEAQRPVLGDAAVDASLDPFREKLAELERQAESPKDTRSNLNIRQRKLITLIYVDVVGSTAMTQHLDPEDNLEMMDYAMLRLVEPIQKHRGRVTRYTGDGFKAMFGDPAAKEDDPEQAIRAGLEILEEAQSLAKDLKKEWDIENFQVRIGIDTGLAALGGQTEAEDTVKGSVVNLAKRIESAAPPGGLLISHNTYRHVRGVFTVEPQVPILAKGFPEPVDVYLVKEIKPRAFRVQNRGVEGVETHMVGRKTELDTLKNAYLTAFEENEGHVVTISGEAGVGKSRLLYEFQNWLELLPNSQVVRFFLGRGEQESKALPYSLLRDLFVFRFQIMDDDSGVQVRQKIESGLADVFDDESAMMKAHIVGQLLGFDFSASPHLKGVLNDAEQIRNRGLNYLIQYFQVISQEIPVVIFLEDIHWSDDSSLDFVNKLGERAAELPILIVCATRTTLSERRPYWGEGQDYHTLLELRPLSKRESRNLVTEILKLAVDIPTELRELVVRGAEGNPFYMEELIKMLIENNVIIPDEEIWRIDLNNLEQIDVPSTLAGVLQARLDSLPAHERTVLQQASVVGRLFWDRIVSYIQTGGGNGDDQSHISQILTSLRYRELVYRHEESAFVGTVEYLFKHDVLREVTYDSVIKRLRKSYHGLVADWLIANSGDRISEYNGLIAQHLLLARREAEAGQYFFQAGESTLTAFANAEAEKFYRQALELFPADPLRANILSGLGESQYRQGSVGEASSNWQEAINIYKDLGDLDSMGDIYVRLSNLLWSSDQPNAWRVCREGLELLKGSQDSPGYARLLAEAGRIALFRTETDQIMPLCQEALEMSDRIGELEVYLDANITIAIHIDDIKKRKSIFEEVIDLAEANGLSRIAARAHINLSNYLGQTDLKATLIHLMRGAEIAKTMSEIDMMMFALNMIVQYYPDLGKLNSMEEKMVEFLEDANIPEEREKEFWLEVHRKLMIKRGEWKPALEATRKRANVFRERSDIQMLDNTNSDLIEIILELNRFGKLDDLNGAERALQEKIELDFYPKYSLPYKAIILARQSRLAEARDWLAKSLDEHGYDENDLDYNELRLFAEFELACAEKQWTMALSSTQSLHDIYQKSGRCWSLARKLIDLGDVLAARKNPGDLEQARETYLQSLDMFTEMGATGYIKVLEERLENF